MFWNLLQSLGTRGDGFTSFIEDNYNLLLLSITPSRAIDRLL